LGMVIMRRKRVPTSWFRRLTQPFREFLRVDIDLTEQALRRSSPSAQRFFCVPARFMLWFLDELEAAAADLRSLMVLRRPGSRPSDPAE
jgi:hypothetical protein